MFDLKFVGAKVAAKLNLTQKNSKSHFYLSSNYFFEFQTFLFLLKKQKILHGKITLPHHLIIILIRYNYKIALTLALQQHLDISLKRGLEKIKCKHVDTRGSVS